MMMIESLTSSPGSLSEPVWRGGRRPTGHCRAAWSVVRKHLLEGRRAASAGGRAAPVVGVVVVPPRLVSLLGPGEFLAATLRGQEHARLTFSGRSVAMRLASLFACPASLFSPCVCLACKLA